ncbi:hypothetical protein CSC66_09190 [Pseudoxanthomonas kaohsiungensis]|nr:hypothetical protein CSC66_09190 [Pseudoxanthomonas kaohsiungensis]
MGVPAAIGERVAESEEVCCLDGPVGRMVWVYVLASRREAAEQARRVATEARGSRGVDPLDDGSEGCGDPNCGCATRRGPYLASIRTRRSKAGSAG